MKDISVNPPFPSPSTPPPFLATLSNNFSLPLSVFQFSENSLKEIKSGGREDLMNNGENLIYKRMVFREEKTPIKLFPL